MLEKGANPDLGVYDGASIDSDESGGETALIFAIDRDKPEDRLEVVKLLLNAGANIDLQDNTGRTALMYAKVLGHPSHEQELIERGADMNVLEDARGRTARDYGATTVPNHFVTVDEDEEEESRRLLG